MRFTFTDRGWADYLHWQEHDRKVLARLNTLLAECARAPFTGIGKPEPLRDDLSGWWSRRITDEHRLVYQVRDADLVIAACRYHYKRR